jgi:FkbM family methyltransferase
MINSFGLLRSILIYYGNPFKTWAFRRFYSKFIRRGDLCFDIGAHVGNRTAILRKLGSRVVAVEPQPILSKYLTSKFARDPDVIIIPKAIGSSGGQGQLHLSAATPTVSSLSQEWIRAVSDTTSFRDVRWEQEITVPITTLDALLEEFGLPVYIKIDVEGFESEALRGLSHPVRLISFEYIPAARQIALDSLGWINSLGNYVYNWTIKESAVLRSGSWLAYGQMVEILNSMSADGDSGDIYCQLRKSHTH